MSQNLSHHGHEEDNRDRDLLVMLRAIHARSHETYGSPPVHAGLRAKGICAGRKRVEWLMATSGLRGFEPEGLSLAP